MALDFQFPDPGRASPYQWNVPPGVLVNAMQCGSHGFWAGAVTGSFVGLDDIRGNYPVMEKTSLWSARIDHIWNNRNNSFLRVGVSPSLVTGLPSTSQNQVFGQNSGSRAGYNQSRDLSFTFQHTPPSAIGPSMNSAPKSPAVGCTLVSRSSRAVTRSP